MHIALIYSKYEDLDASITEFNPHGPTQMNNTILSIKEVLETNDHQVTSLEADNDLLTNLEKIETPDLLFNLSTGISDKRSQANIVGMLEMTKIPMVGSGLTSHVLGLHKEITKSLLSAHGIRTAPSQLVSDKNEKIREDFTYPLVVKPEHEGTGIGITDSSKVENPKQLRNIIHEKIDLHNQVLLIEEFLPGREFTIGVLGNSILEIFPIEEIIFIKDGPQMLTGKLKTEDDIDSEIPANISEELKEEIESMVKKTFRILRCQDFARIDIRLDRDGKPNVIELNTFPGLEKGVSYFPILGEAAGYSYNELINRLVEISMEPKALQ